MKNVATIFAQRIPVVKSFLTRRQLGIADTVMADLSKANADQHYLDMLKTEYGRWQAWYAKLQITATSESNLRSAQADAQALAMHACTFLCGVTSETAEDSTRGSKCMLGIHQNGITSMLVYRAETMNMTIYSWGHSYPRVSTLTIKLSMDDIVSKDSRAKEDYIYIYIYVTLLEPYLVPSMKDDLKSKRVTHKVGGTLWNLGPK